MKKALLIATVLFIAVISTACINNIAVQELNNKAAEYMQKGDYESAVNRLQASIDLDSSIYETYYNLGIAATNAKKYDVAIEAFENGIKLNPDYANFYYSLAVAQAEKANFLTENNNENADIPEDIDNSDEIITLNVNALFKAKKYLEMSPNAEDIEEVESFIEDLSKTEEPEKTPLLEG